MTSILLAKYNLPPGTIDCAIGEAELIKDNLVKIFNIPHDIKINNFSYLDPAGYQPLVKLLEDKHQAPVVITNGAKQALGASFYAMKRASKINLGMHTPYWCLIPPLVSMHGLNNVFLENDTLDGCDSYLCVAPNNPDGYMHDLLSLVQECKNRNLPLIHDAVYYNHNYLPSSYKLDPIGDLQIFSLSKYLGLSNLRVGYIVCHNKDYYHFVKEYVEHMTVGVSALAQSFAYDILTQVYDFDLERIKFESSCFQDLQEAKNLVKTISNKVLEIPNNIEQIPGMFLWAKFLVHQSYFDFDANIRVAWGSHFGNKDYMRMNLALSKESLLEVIRRLNQYADKL